MAALFGCLGCSDIQQQPLAVDDPTGTDSTDDEDDETDTDADLRVALTKGARPTAPGEAMDIDITVTPAGVYTVSVALLEAQPDETDASDDEPPLDFENWFKRSFV